LGNSPYQSPSAFAGNPLLISPELLLKQGLLSADVLYAEDGVPLRAFPAATVDFPAATAWKQHLLETAFACYNQHPDPTLQAAFAAFRAEHAAWLDDYACFMAIREHLGGATLSEWDPAIRTRNPAKLQQLRQELAPRITFYAFTQFLFFQQWFALKQYANAHGVEIIGDAPIFVAYDSADVWANPDIFFLDEHGLPSVVAGVPPDYFSADGQLWGNPLYNWEQLASQDYAWWVARMRHNLKLVDVLRLDHFRGFEAYWEIPANAKTAREGVWQLGPGAAFFETLARELGDLPIIAEDLGLITPEVRALRDQFHLPGMLILQFAFGDDARNPYLPHNYSANNVVYTGTHDNNTTVGWFAELDEPARERIRAYLGHAASDIAWDLLRVGYASTADVVIAPLQDVLRLDSDARQNTPGTIGDQNWTWRYTYLDPGLAQGLRFFADLYGRIVPQPDPNPNLTQDASA
jgi:4-alpha-glucanotransferase